MINWGIVGAGHIARVFCNGLRFSKTGTLAAVASRSLQRATELANLFECNKAFGSYVELFDDDSIDAVYVSTIHPAHLECVLAATEAKKHVLVEKPIGLNRSEAQQMFDAAKKYDVFLMEGYMYRCHPQIQRAVELVRDGAIGEVQFIRSRFGYRADYDPKSRVLDSKLGGGAILDVGGYPMSLARLFAGAAAGLPFLNPIELNATGIVGPTGVDELTAANLKFENHVIAEISTSITCELPSMAEIHGTKATLKIPSPWLPSSPCRDAKHPLPLDTTFLPAELILNGQKVVIECDRDLFSYEADEFEASIDSRHSEAISSEDSLGNIDAMNRWRQAIGG
jgi:predicted dehydrogenase